MYSVTAGVPNGMLYLSLSLFALALLQKYRDSTRGEESRHPPSPRSFPLVGNLFSIPPEMEHIAYMKLGEQLNSNTVFLRLFGYDFIVLNSSHVATDLLEKRSGLYSDRLCPPMVADTNLMDWSGNPVLTKYGDTWRLYRRMVNNWLNARAVIQFHGIQEQRIQPLLRRLVQLQDDPEPFERLKHAFFHNAAATMLKLAYGYTLQGDNDQIFEDIRRTNENVVVGGMFTNFLVNIFPSLSRLPDWLPGTSWKRIAREWREQKERSQTVPYEWAKSQLAAGVAEPSILSALLQNRELTSHLSEEEREYRLKEVAGVIVAAGTDTTSTALVAFAAAMVLNPHVQAKAQNELDSILGPISLPTMTDRERLPYINNLIQEVLRWQPVTPTGIPHACWKDDNYEGYDIKKGTVVIGNVWAMSRDEAVYKNSETFDPDRFLDSSVPHAPAFGWGRRKCPGIHFAEATLFMTVASLLATFTFSKKRNVNGQGIEPRIEGVTNAIIMGEPILSDDTRVGKLPPIDPSGLLWLTAGRLLGSETFLDHNPTKHWSLDTFKTPDLSLRKCVPFSLVDMRGIIFGVLGVVSLASANPVSRVDLDPSDASLPVPSPTRPLEWGDVNVLHTTDIHGWISGHSKEVYPEKSWSGNFGDFFSFVIHMRDIAKRRNKDLLLVDTGDRRIGHGLTDGLIEPGGVYGRKASLLYRDMEYDLVVPGNHDLESPKVVNWTMSYLAPSWGDRYLTSNVNRLNGSALGVHYRRWKSPRGKRMMAFGVVPYKTKPPKDLLKVVPINKMVNETWFKDAIKREQDPNNDVDVFVVLGHVDPQTDEPVDNIELIYTAIRQEHPYTPILIFAGHTHKRWCRYFGERDSTRSMLIQSGKYFDTVGWMSVVLDDNTAPKNLTFSRRYLDNNVQTYMYHAGIKAETNFHTVEGIGMTAFIKDIEKSANLSEVYGELKSDFFLDRVKWTEQENDTQSLFSFYLDAAQHSLIRPEESTNWLFFSNWGIVRGEIYKGPFTLSDLFSISPNASDDSPFVYTTVSRQIADQIVEMTQRVHKAGGNITKVLEPQPETVEIINDDSQVHFSLSTRNPDDGLTYGLVTEDLCGNGGDDVRHSKVPQVSFDQKDMLPVYFWRKGYKSMPQGNANENVTLIVTNYIGNKWVPVALKLLNAGCGDCGVKPYREDLRQNKLLITYIQSKFPYKKPSSE